MKRNTRKVEKRTFALQNALPRFVSIVSRGANLTPLSELRFADEADRFSDVEINRIVFSKENFTAESVNAYLQENDYTEFSIEETETTYVVPGVEADQFHDVAPIEYGDGVQFFVGKLKDASELEQTTTAVVDAEILDFQEPDKGDEVTTEAEPELVQEADLTVEDLEVKPESTNEEVANQGDEADGEKGPDQESEVLETLTASEPEVDHTEVEQAVFNDKLFRDKATAALAQFFETLDAAKTEAFSLPVESEVEVFTAEQVAVKVQEAVDAAIESFKLTDNVVIEENSVDETTILVQNSQVVQSEEITDTVSRNKDENLQFSERKRKDLFGL